MWFNEQITNNLTIKEIIVNFMPSWWYKNYGISYGRDMIFNSDYRINADREMRKVFYERFGRFCNSGSSDPKERIVFPDWDNTYYQTMLGFDTQYPADQYPCAGGQLTDDEAMALKVPENFWDVYPFNEQARQIKEMSRRFNRDIPLWVRTRGILNEGVQICGSDFYGELLDEDCDEKTAHVFSFILGVIEQQLLSNKKCNAEASHIMMNCTAAVAGARTYSAHVLDYDRAIYNFCVENGIGIGLHHCGRFDDFVNVYSVFRELYFIEIGHTSKIRPVLEAYPNADIQYIVDTKFMYNSTVPSVREFCGEIKEQIRGHENRFHLSIPDLDAGTPDDNIMTVIEEFQK